MAHTNVHERTCVCVFAFEFHLLRTRVYEWILHAKIIDKIDTHSVDSILCVHRYFLLYSLELECANVNCRTQNRD